MEPEKLIQKYFSNTLTPDELQVLQDYLEQEDLSVLYTRMTKEWEATANQALSLAPDVSSNLWQRILCSIQPKIHLFQNRWLGYAAAAMLIFALGFGLWANVKNGATQTEWLTYSTEYGEQKEVVLPDGTNAMLNGNSELLYFKNWEEGKTRKVWLNGEAYFEVADRHEEGIKFQVITPELSVEVLGTQFNVNTQEDLTRVYLEEGKVQLFTQQQSDRVEMVPGELLVYSHTSQSILSHELTDAGHHLSWRRGVLLFDDTPMREFLNRFEEVYGVKIFIEDSLLYERNITFGVPSNDLEMAMSFMEESMNLKVLRQNDTIRIR